jgi:uncharacterized protein (DUF433 family)
MCHCAINVLASLALTRGRRWRGENGRRSPLRARTCLLALKSPRRRRGSILNLKVSPTPRRLTRPLYSFAEADRLAGVTSGTTRRWIKGYHYSRGGKRSELPPVTPRDEKIQAASFLDLLEVVAIGRFKEIGIPLPAVRRIVLECKELLDLPRPLVQLQFKSDGREVFIDRGATLLGLGKRKRHLAWNDVLKPFLNNLDYADGWAEKWWPLGHEKPILVDPDYGFGQPVIAGSGVRTEIILERVRAGDLPQEIAYDFNIEELDVLRAIQYETTRQAA